MSVKTHTHTHKLTTSLYTFNFLLTILGVTSASVMQQRLMAIVKQKNLPQEDTFSRTHCKANHIY